jgi:hypothetical protein
VAVGSEGGSWEKVKLTEHAADTAPVVYVALPFVQVPKVPATHVPPTEGGVAYPMLPVTVNEAVEPPDTLWLAGVTDPPVPTVADTVYFALPVVAVITVAEADTPDTETPLAAPPYRLLLGEEVELKLTPFPENHRLVFEAG